MAKKGSNVPEKPKTPQQLWYNHEKKAILKTRPDVCFISCSKTCSCFLKLQLRRYSNVGVLSLTSGHHQRHQGQSGQTVDTAVRQEEAEMDHQVSGAEEAVRGRNRPMGGRQKGSTFPPDSDVFVVSQEVMREYIQQHPELNMTQDDIVKSTLTKAERHLKDKSDGRPDKPPP